MTRTFQSVTVIIPAFEPGKELIETVDALSPIYGEHIIVVNDGSSRQRDELFHEISKKAIVIRHHINKGKGEALKTAFKYVLENHPESTCIVTVDADGQHLATDIIKVTEAALLHSEKLCLGVRNFGSEIPLRSLVGNIATKYLFAFLSKKRIEDTQTGLRAIPASLLGKLVEIPNQKYEYEMAMLYVALQNGIDIQQIPITTVYQNNNASSHFRPILDALRIYSVLFRYSTVSLVSAALDYVLFLLFYSITENIFAASIIARALSFSVNYLFNRMYTFHSSKSFRESFPKYVVLVVVNPLISAGMVSALGFLAIPIALGKIIAEGIMFGANYYIQKKYIF